MGPPAGGQSRPGLGMIPTASGGSRPARPGDELPDDCKLYVGNLPISFTDSTLKTMFEPFGNVLHAVVLMDQVTGVSRG